MSQRSPILLVLVLLLGSTPCSTGDSVSISAEVLRRHVEFLASDRMAGRETGEPEVHRAEEYIARAFREYGLEPLPGRDDFFVPFDLYRRGFDAAKTRLAVEVGGVERTFRPGDGFRPFDFSDEGMLEAEVVFAGYGITAEEHEYDDYAGLDVQGKIVLMLRHEPGETDPTSSFDGTESSRHALFSSKAANAADHGAAAMLLVTDPLNHGPGDDLRMGRSLSLDPSQPDETGGESEGEPLLALQISREAAEGLLAAAGATLAEMQTAIDGGAPASSFDLRGATARIGVARMAEAETVPARDVVGIVEGSDPELKHEWIVVGGHHDHVGAYSAEEDSVFNGADDNASGTSGVLELARSFAAARSKPKRSIVFATFSGEEKGLLGSRALVSEGRLPIDRVKFMLNLDMIGRNSSEPIQVIGDGFASGLRSIVEAANEKTRLNLRFAGASYSGNSDHDSFYREDIPFVFLFTGIHDDYHQVGDHAEKLDYAAMEKIVRLARGVVGQIAGADVTPGFVHRITWLGLQIEILDGAKGPAAVVTAVEEQSRAAAAGFVEGDALLAFDEMRMGEPDEVGRLFREIEPGSAATILVRRGGEERPIEVQRARTGYMGVMTGGVAEEQRQALALAYGEGVTLTQVVAGGPSAEAGLQAGDIVIRISGRPVDSASLRSRLAQVGAGETVEVMVVRDGERITMPLTLGERPQR